MHKANLPGAWMRGFSGGGARALIDKMDPSQLMQEFKGNMFKGETRDKVEHPMNYGFVSLVAKAIKGKMGEISNSAEGFMSFMGGNRSFPMIGIMDDRRHRLLDIGSTSAGNGGSATTSAVGVQVFADGSTNPDQQQAADDKRSKAVEGSCGMHGLREWGHQSLICDTGIYVTARADGQSGGGGGSGSAREGAGGSSGGGQQTEGTEVVQQLVPNENDQGGNGKQQGSGSGVGVSLLADGSSSGSSGSSGTSGGNAKGNKGQKDLHGQKGGHPKAKVKGVMDNKNWLMRHNDSYHRLNPSRNVNYFQSESAKSCRCDGNHWHGASAGNRYWGDNGGLWYTVPPQPRGDPCQTALTAADWALPVWKDDFAPLEPARVRDIFERAKVYTCTWTEHDRRDVGLRPDELQQLYPEGIFTRGEPGDEDYIKPFVWYERLIPLLMAAMQDGYRQVNEQRAQINELREQVDELRRTRGSDV